LPTPNPFRQNGGVSLSEKIVRWEDLPQWRSRLRASGRKLVVTNGCFDLLHAGHVTYLERARGLGDVLLIGLNGDASVRELKGPGRPVNTEQDRATVLAALESVTGVCIFSERSANPFLAIAEPDIYVKGGDYTIDTIPQDERRTVEKAGGRIHFLGFVPGKSTTALLKSISGC
jgi:rfaE bifunctional protein nucleotidyltransferase chain/domain